MLTRLAIAQVTLQLAEQFAAHEEWTDAANLLQQLTSDDLTMQFDGDGDDSENGCLSTVVRFACVEIKAAVGLEHAPEATKKLLAWLKSPACATSKSSLHILTAYVSNALPTSTASAFAPAKVCLDGAFAAASLIMHRFPLARAAAANLAVRHLLAPSLTDGSGERLVVQLLGQEEVVQSLIKVRGWPRFSRDGCCAPASK